MRKQTKIILSIIFIIFLILSSCEMDTGSVSKDVKLSDNKQEEDDIGTGDIEIGDDEIEKDSESSESSSSSEDSITSENNSSTDSSISSEAGASSSDNNNQGNDDDDDDNSNQGNDDDDDDNNNQGNDDDDDDNNNQGNDDDDDDKYLTTEELFNTNPEFFIVSIGYNDDSNFNSNAVNLKYYDLIVDVKNKYAGIYKIEVDLTIKGDLPGNGAFLIEILDDMGDRIGAIVLKVRKNGNITAKGIIKLTQPNQRIIFSWEEAKGIQRKKGAFKNTLSDVIVKSIRFYAKKSQFKKYWNN